MSVCTARTCARPSVSGLCDRCRGRKRAYYAAKRRQWADEGRCTNCGSARDTGHRQCDRCRVRRRRQRAAAGQCTRCGGKGELGYAQCGACRAKVRDAVRRFRAR